MEPPQLREKESLQFSEYTISRPSSTRGSQQPCIPDLEKAEAPFLVQSTIREPLKGITEEGKLPDEHVVDLEGPDDPSNPLNWPTWYKWMTVVLVSLMTFVNTLGSVITAPGVPLILAEFHSTNPQYTTLLVSIYEMGETFGPLLIAPMAELYGRLPVWHISNILFVAFCVGCALSSNLSMLIAFRFLSGCASAPTVIGPSIIGDIFVPEQRGKAMSLNIIGPLIGPVAGPVAGGFLTQLLGWRWMFWIMAIAGSAFAVPSLLFLKETYKVTLLERKVKKLRAETGNQALRSKYDTGATPSNVFKQAIIRPAKLAIFSPVVLIIALYASVVYGYLYIIFTTLTEVMQMTYHFTQGATGLSYLGLGIGFVIGLVIFTFLSDRLLRRASFPTPETRLTPLLLTLPAVPTGLLLYGFTARPSIPFPVPIIGTALVSFGVMLTAIPTKTYFVDAFELHAASALAVGVICQSAMAVVLPLGGPGLYAKLGLGGGNAVLAGVAVSLAPVPVLVWKYGAVLRGRSLEN